MRATASKLFKRVPASKLGVSEPDPSWFGNKPNEEKNPTWTNKNWLKSRFHFSFAEYSNPRNQAFGVLRVMNDDLVQPSRGFGTHPHRDAEICTYVVDGELTHQDSLGTKETLTRGAIQFITAGSGVRHSEHNLHATKSLRFIQIWINTKKAGVKPNYGSSVGDYEQRHNKFAHLVSDAAAKAGTPVQIQADANIHVTELDAGKQAHFEVADGRQAYLLCVEGDTTVAGGHGEASLERHDGAEITGPNSLDFKAGANGAHLLLVEMANDGSGGRTDL